MLASIMKESVLTNPGVAAVPMALLALVIRLAVPRAMKEEKSGFRFALGVVIFAAYTLITMLTIWWVTFGAASAEECVVRACVAVALVNLMMLFAAAIFFFTREKRTISQEEKMKLKDL